MYNNFLFSFHICFYHLLSFSNPKISSSENKPRDRDQRKRGSVIPGFSNSHQSLSSLVFSFLMFCCKSLRLCLCAAGCCELNIKPQTEVNLSVLWAKLWYIIYISAVLPKITQSLQWPWHSMLHVCFTLCSCFSLAVLHTCAVSQYCTFPTHYSSTIDGVYKFILKFHPRLVNLQHMLFTDTLLVC